MEPNYIQLPPLPSDMPTELIEIVWGYAKMEKPEKEKFLNFLRDNMKPDRNGKEKEKPERMQEESPGKVSPYVEEFSSLMKEFLGTLIVQACEMSSFIYQCYCIEGKSIKEISEIIHAPENFIVLIAQHYQRKKE